MRPPTTFRCTLCLIAVLTGSAAAQPLGSPDRESPGDAMIQEYLARETARIEDDFLGGATTLEDWQKRRPEYVREYLYMLGLWPVPEKTPLEATVTGTVERDGYIVENLHYQSMPKLYVTANLYRPADVKEGERLPAVLYVCGHSGRGRNGNKTAFQSHGIWLAKHGYVCLIVDTLQLGEIAAIHHGTYREERWWWHSRGYTPAGVECWNGVRGIDYLVSRPDVDPERIGVTGISGGGAATFWVAAADERVKVAIPVSGMADLSSYVSNRVINGHCDCMFLYNTFEWPWARIAALVAPRPLLFVNSDADPIFPMDANRRVINRLEDLYSLHAAGDRVDSVVSVGGHAYREDIRQAAFRFLNIYLKNDASPVTDSESDVISEGRTDETPPIALEALRAFVRDEDLPRDELNTSIDRHFVPMAKVEPPRADGFAAWKHALVDELRRVSFRTLPEAVAAARPVGEDENAADSRLLETEPGIRVSFESRDRGEDRPGRIVLLVKLSGPKEGVPDWLRMADSSGQRVRVCVLRPRGVEPVHWTRKNPPNYVERSHALLGRTVDTGRVRDIVAVVRHLREKFGSIVPIDVAGEGAAGVLAAYAALWDPEIAGVLAHAPSSTHMQEHAPQFLNVLRVCDIPDVFGMLAPRPVTISGSVANEWKKTAAIYTAAGEADRLTINESSR